VILGDPGSGKSSLLQYLALEWVEGKTENLPLLIELREFALNPAANFLEFLHRGRGVDWQFDQQQLHQHLLESPTLVMFDGLDEVFDRATQSTIIDDIIRFSQQYPNAQVLMTSRIIGYNPERLQHSGFRHFTLQSLDTDEIHEFIDRWYDLSMGSDPDKVRLKQRLKDAIANSKAIANLADNPLLLTMMAILNRRQELPRDRADLYDQASRVLLYHWDVDHKRLQIPMDAIGRREKQEMLRLIAYEMQAGEEGLKGNLISAERLTRILTDYLRDQGFSEPREKANLLIQQLRERNFILCYRGADTYGFMHRTFLEYFVPLKLFTALRNNALSPLSSCGMRCLGNIGKMRPGMRFCG
jgi:predicted NACHT family NTPase